MSGSPKERSRNFVLSYEAVLQNVPTPFISVEVLEKVLANRNLFSFLSDNIETTGHRYVLAKLEEMLERDFPSQMQAGILRQVVGVVEARLLQAKKEAETRARASSATLGLERTIPETLSAHQKRKINQFLDVLGERSEIFVLVVLLAEGGAFAALTPWGCLDVVVVSDAFSTTPWQERERQLRSKMDSPWTIIRPIAVTPAELALEVVPPRAYGFNGDPARALGFNRERAVLLARHPHFEYGPDFRIRRIPGNG